jgi:hypothetical protein
LVVTLEPPRPAQQISPESTQVVNATGCRAEQRGVAHQQLAGERVWSRLQQRVKAGTAVSGEGVWRGGRVNVLPGEHIHPLGSRSNSFQLGQVGMKVECLDAPQQVEGVACAIDLDGRWRAVGRGGGAQTEAVVVSTLPGRGSARRRDETFRPRGVLVVEHFVHT